MLEEPRGLPLPRPRPRVLAPQRGGGEGEGGGVRVRVVLEVLVAPPHPLAGDPPELRLRLAAQAPGDGLALRRGQRLVQPVVAERHAQDVVAGDEVGEVLVRAPLLVGGQAQELGLRHGEEVVAAGHEPREGQLGHEVAVVTGVLERRLPLRHRDHPRQVLPVALPQEAVARVEPPAQVRDAGAVEQQARVTGPHRRRRGPDPARHERHRVVERAPDRRVREARAFDVEHVAEAGQGDELVGHSRRLQRARHLHRPLVGHVRVAVPVKEKRRRVVGRHVADGAERVEGPRLAVGVVARDEQRPEAALAGVAVEDETAGLVPLRDRFAPDRALRLFGAHGRVPEVARVRPAVPGAGDVAVAVERDDRQGPRAEACPGHQGQVPAGRVAHHGQPRRVEAEGRALAPQPLVRRVEVLEDAVELRLRGEAVVDRDHGEAGAQVPLALALGQHSRSPKTRAPPWIHSTTGWGPGPAGRKTSAGIESEPTVR